MYNYIIFDVDGTILDTEKAVLNSLQQTLKEEGRQYKLGNLRFALGIPGKETLNRLNIPEVDRIHSKWAQLETEYSKDATLFPDLETVIDHLGKRKIKLGIVTSKTKQGMVDTFDPLGLSSYFEEMITADDTTKHKPHPEPLLSCMERLNAPPSKTIYIGDSIYDMQSAKAAGIKFGLALWGAKTTEKFDSADYIFKQPIDIIDWIQT
ncbi:HAD family hydrolase [Aerococcus urinaeequi]|jgi:HAD superfamily hydrolase (TIGR01509 family)|uniref:HAD family hydrolase n=1 Tax=Lactobacillales TaxID=186826 RepID=UPI0011F01A90|nr:MULTISPECIES: HAD family hydrolase [Lactobacillales]KAF3301363.1 HAD-IA family hydrolase [Carnobacterium sp. PL12RED10]MCT1797558.1 HAD family hydrolase [Aerococcus viridans]